MTCKRRGFPPPFRCGIPGVNRPCTAPPLGRCRPVGSRWRDSRRDAGSQPQSQVQVDGRQYLDEVRCPVAVQPFQLPHEEKAVAAVTVIAEVLHLVHAAVSVEIDVAGSLAVLIQRVEEVPTDAPVAGQVVFEHRQAVICPA